jgi:hypothetical protein
MKVRRIKRPSPAFVMATIALFVGLGGTASAVATQAVPLAKRAFLADKAKTALVADNAKKLGGESPSALLSQAAQTPGPASSAAGIFSIKTGTWSLGPGAQGNFTVTCDAGQKAVSGGWSDPGNYSSAYQTMPTSDGNGWTINIYTSFWASASQGGTTYAICVK